MEKMRDSIDFKEHGHPTLFLQTIAPTVLWMIFPHYSLSPTGIFVGKESAVMLWRRSTLWHRYGCFLRVWTYTSRRAPRQASIHLSHGKESSGTHQYHAVGSLHLPCC